MLFILIFLAVVQGLTEFLPVSSSGHLSLISYIFSLDMSNMLLFFLVVHAGTAVAALFYFKNDIMNILIGLVDWVQKRKTSRAEDSLKWILLIFMVSLPTGIIGLTLKQPLEQLGNNMLNIGIALIVTAIILLRTKFIVSKNYDLHSFSYKSALLVGFAQSFALIPGISRSGSTIAMALFLGATSLFAGKLSFLASFVAIFGALLLEVFDYMQSEVVVFPLYYFIICFFVSFCVGLYALKFLMRILNHGKLYLFSPYCFLLGFGVILYYFIKL